jgi:hypothetical protein
MLISGMGYSYDPEKTTLFDAVAESYKKYVSRKGHKPTHVHLPKTAKAEDIYMINKAFSVTVSGAKHGSPLIVIGMAKENEDAVKE